MTSNVYPYNLPQIPYPVDMPEEERKKDEIRRNEILQKLAAMNQTTARIAQNMTPNRNQQYPILSPNRPNLQNLIMTPPRTVVQNPVLSAVRTPARTPVRTPTRTPVRTPQKTTLSPKVRNMLNQLTPTEQIELKQEIAQEMSQKIEDSIEFIESSVESDNLLSEVVEDKNELISEMESDKLLSGVLENKPDFISEMEADIKNSPLIIRSSPRTRSSPKRPRSPYSSSPSTRERVFGDEEDDELEITVNRSPIRRTSSPKRLSNIRSRLDEEGEVKITATKSPIRRVTSPTKTETERTFSLHFEDQDEDEEDVKLKVIKSSPRKSKSPKRSSPKKSKSPKRSSPKKSKSSPRKSKSSPRKSTPKKSKVDYNSYTVVQLKEMISENFDVLHDNENVMSDYPDFDEKSYKKYKKADLVSILENLN